MQKKELENQAKKLGVYDYTKFVGMQLPKNIPSWMGCADVLVLPSLSEGKGIVILEAMAAGLPVVASNVGGIPESVIDGQTGFLVKPKDPKQITNKLNILLNNNKLWIKMSNTSKKRVKELDLTWHSCAKKYDELYHKILKN